jgi:hypothetical protein
MSISIAKVEVDSRLTHPPPSFSLHDIAQFWGAFFDIALPINWYLRLAMRANAPTERSE